MKRTTIFLPDELHERLRREAFRNRVSMAKLIRSRIEGGRTTRKQTRLTREDPLLKAAGIFHDGKLTEGIDEALYGI